MSGDLGSPELYTILAKSRYEHPDPATLISLRPKPGVFSRALGFGDSTLQPLSITLNPKPYYTTTLTSALIQLRILSRLLELRGETGGSLGGGSGTHDNNREWKP